MVERSSFVSRTSIAVAGRSLSADLGTERGESRSAATAVAPAQDGVVTHISSKPCPRSEHPRIDEIGGQMSKKNGLADPTRLKPFDLNDKQLLRVVIETPKGSRNKFAFNADEHVFELKKVLPSGMTFPYDFGFVPSTESDDGDPVDVLVWMDEPA